MEIECTELQASQIRDLKRDIEEAQSRLERHRRDYEYALDKFEERINEEAKSEMQRIVNEINEDADRCMELVRNITDSRKTFIDTHNEIAKLIREIEAEVK